jgi:translocation and assembly module TamB
MDKQALKRVGKWAASILVGVALVLLLALGGALLLLQTQYGRDRVAGLVADLTRTTPYQVRIVGLGGAPPWRMDLERVELADDHGVWMALEDVRVRWAVLDMLRRVYHFPLIQADRIDWQRLPHREEPPEEPIREEEPFAIPELPSVRVGELQVRTLQISEEVFGRAQVLTVHGRLDTEGEVWTGLLAMEEPGGLGDGILLDVEHDPEADRLSVRLRVQEEPGGIVGGLLGLTENGPIAATLTGEGPLRNWQGVFSAVVAGYGETEGQVGLSLQRDISLALTGRASVEERRIPAEAAVLLGTRADYALRMSRIDQTLRFEEAVVRAGPVDMGMSGLLELQEQSLDIQINVTFDAIPAAVTELLEERGIRLEGPGPVKGSISGSWRQPEIEADLTAERLAIERADLKNPRILLQGQLLRDPEIESTGFAGRVSVRAESLDIPELPALSPVQGTLELSTPDFETFTIPQLELSSPGLSVTGSGTLHREGWRTEGTIDVHVEDPDKLFDLGETLLPGRVRVQAGFKGALTPPDLRLGVRATASGLGTWPEAARAVTGDQVALKADIGFRGSVVSVGEFTLTGQELELKGSGEADLEQNRFTVTSVGTLRDLAALPGALEGRLAFDAHAAGRFDEFTVEGTARGADVRVSGEPFTEPVSSFRVTGLPSAVEGRVSLTAGYREQPVEVATGFALDGTRVAVRELRARAPGVTVSGDLRADLEERVVSGGLQAEAEDLSFIGALTGLDLAGQVSLGVELTQVQGMQTTTVDLAAADFSVNGFAASSLTLAGRVTDTFVSPGGTVEVSLDQGRVQEVELARLEAALSGGLDALTFQAQASGRVEYPFSFGVQGAASQKDEVRMLRIDALSGEYAELPIVLERPATLTMVDGLLRLTELVLNVDRGVLRAEGDLGEDEVEARLTVHSLPVEILSLIRPVPVQGFIEGDLLLSGPLSAPVLKVELGSTLSQEEEPPRQLQTEVQLSALLEAGMASAILTISGLGPEPARIEASFPALFTLSPFAFEIPPDGALKGVVTGVVELQTVTMLLPMEGHSMTGGLTMDLTLRGTLADPLLHGTVLLAQGRYENYRLAMLVDRANATIRADGREIVLESFSARDGERGRVSAEGRLQLDEERSFPFSTAASFRSFRALRSPELSGAVSGNLQLAGDVRSAQTSGQLTIDPLNLTIPDRIAPAIAQLEVIEINVDPELREPKRAIGPEYRVDLDLKLVFPARFFIRGRGLDAEFSGNLDVTGTAGDPEVRGVLSVVRGDFTFLDRRFELTEANVIFTGAVPPVPILDVTAEWTRQEITVLVLLSGNAMEPTITLESDPMLPSDEILSTVIFGRSVTELTPVQALRLANALRVLAVGANNGFDIFSTLRTTFGLDELEIREDVDGAALDMGRYLHERVYLRLSKGLGTGRDKVSVEVDVHRYISVESEVGTDSQGGIGINYRRNY